MWLNDIDINMFGYYDLNIRFGYWTLYGILEIVEIGDMEKLIIE
jgi:uncharacterized protein with PQ loop repeat